MIYVITGGAGFIGSHLCKELLKLGHKVFCIDNYYTSSVINIDDFIDDVNFTLIYSDISKINLIESLSFYIDVMDIDCIINLASPASPIHYQKDPVYTMMTNVMGAVNVLELAKISGARVLQASTSEVYGDPLIHPQIEEYFGNVNPIGPRSCYDESKRSAETLFFDYNRMYGIDIGVFRLFNTYGPKMAVNDGRVVSNFIISALQNELMIIQGDGSQTRSFCYVDDTVKAIIKFSCLNHETGPINIGNPGEFTIKELSDIIIAKVGSGGVKYAPLPQNDPIKRKPDITKAKSILGWEPIINLDAGLDKTIEYFRNFV